MKKIDWPNIIASIITSALACGTVIGLLYNMASQPMKDGIEINKCSISLLETRCNKSLKQVNEDHLKNELRLEKALAQDVRRLELDISDNRKKVEGISDLAIMLGKMQSDTQHFAETISYIKDIISELKVDIKEVNRKRED